MVAQLPENIHDEGHKWLLSKKKNSLGLLKNFVNEAWILEINEDDFELIDKEFISRDFKDKEVS